MKNKHKIEILAPCGSFDAMRAAVRQGADAVYMGLERFSARAYAENFSDEELTDAIKYCHLHNVKVHIAVNTLVRDDELNDAQSEVKRAYLAGADAFIVQDIGLATLIKQACPNAELHASTQLTVHTPGGARFLESVGFDRVVLAREMSRSEIAEVTKSCSVDTEVFVHGALCMCVSGQCYLSAMLGGRSGNRGRCAQPCRLPFSVKDGTGHDLSLKDNSIIDRISELEELGVTSAKIEGRMKRPEYVAAAAAACKYAADNGSADKSQTDRLRAVFSRSGFTDGYYTGNRGREMFGTRSKDDVTAATNKLLADIRSEYKDEPQTNAVSMTLRIKRGMPSSLAVKCGDIEAEVTAAEPQQAKTKPLTDEKAKEQLRKTGGTAFYAENIETEIESGLTLPLSELNLLRRNALESLKDKIEAPPKRIFTAPDISPVKPHITDKGAPGAIRAVMHDCDVPDSFKACEIVFVPLFSEDNELLRLKERGINIGVKLPRIIFGREKAAVKRMEEVKELGITDAYCGNIGTAAEAVKLGMKVHGGYSLNVFNSRSLEFLDKMGLSDTETSFELTARQINALGGSIKRGAVAYGYLPLMIMRNCPNRNNTAVTCGKCKGKSEITDRRGATFTMMCDSGCTELLNCEPLMLSDKLNEFSGADFITLMFTFETASQREEILNCYLHQKKPKGKFTRGLYFRGVQ